MSHSGLIVQVTGRVTLQLSAKTVGLFEAFYNSLKPVTVVDYTLEIQKSGKLYPHTGTAVFLLPFQDPAPVDPAGTFLLRRLAIMIHYCTIELVSLNSFCTNDGTTELPFEFRLDPLVEKQLYETYHGVYVNVQYTIQAGKFNVLLF